MHVTVDTEGGAAAVGLDQPEDCTRFDVVVRGTGHAAAVDAALRGAGAGELDGEGEALVGVAWVRRMAAGRVGEGWETAFAGMLDYARAKGWVSEDGASIRAHLERS